MKKIIPILLLLVISINHLNIIDAVLHYSTRYQVEKNNKEQKNFPADEETEKESQCKENGEEQEKFYTGHHYLLTNKFHLSATDRFICYTTALHKHPYQDDDIQPPKAA